MIKQILIGGAFGLIAMNLLFAEAIIVPATLPKAGVSDSIISSKIKALYQQSPLLSTTQITVETNNQHVILTGTVNTNSQYEQAVSLAHSVPYVADVNAANLKVLERNDNATSTDAYITAKVRSLFMQAQLFGDKPVEYWPVKIETKDGVVYLSGVVETQEQLVHIVRITQSIAGIKSVNSTIRVK